MGDEGFPTQSGGDESFQDSHQKPSQHQECWKGEDTFGQWRHDQGQVFQAWEKHIRWERIIKIEIEPTASTYYDITVPGAGNYWADGVFHHNSAKTTGLAEDVTRHCWRNAGAKVIIAREFEESQADTTIDTFFQFFEKLGALYTTGGTGLFRTWNNGRTFRVPSLRAVEAMQKEAGRLKTRAEIAHWIQTTGDALCGYIHFRGLPDAEKGKFRGMECSYLALVEADQISQAKFALSLGCLRWKGADQASCDEKGYIKDKCVVLDTNPPSPSHWIAEMEETEKKKPEAEQVMKFWHLKTDDNAHNLPDNYIRDMIMLPYASNPAMIQRMRYGEYADAFAGKPVFYAYDMESHEATKLGWPKGATCIVGMDVGTNNASVISALLSRGGHEYLWTMREIVLTESDTERQCIELLKVLGKEFPFWNQGGETCPQTLFFCDPAAANSSYMARGPTSSAVTVMRSHGIYPRAKMDIRGLQQTLAIVNRVLLLNHEEKLKDGSSVITHFKIDTERCPKLTKGLRGEYRYPTKDEPGYDSDKPLKGALCNHVDHIVDSWRYSLCNSLAIAKVDHPANMTQAKPYEMNAEPKAEF